ncbi:MAG: NlpC/P60 family protein [Pseudomonadota bacterium]
MSAHFSGRVGALARGWIGTPYRHQASLKTVGADCLGLIRGVWRELYENEPQIVPAYTRDWAEVTVQDTLLEAAQQHLVPVERSEIQTGDVLLFRYRANLPCKHAAIAVSEMRMIHAYDGAAVAETSIGPWWRRRIAAIFTFPEMMS